MSEVEIFSKNGHTEILVDGRRLKNVKSYSINHDAFGCPVLNIELLVDSKKSYFDLDSDVIWEFDISYLPSDAKTQLLETLKEEEDKDELEDGYYWTRYHLTPDIQSIVQVANGLVYMPGVEQNWSKDDFLEFIKIPQRNAINFVDEMWT